jgi:nitrite reductase/ring-hydroxylating ferredoxin subunit
MAGWLGRILGGRSKSVSGTEKIAEGSSRRVCFGDLTAGDPEVVLARIGGRLHAVDSTCPHERGRIDEGPLVDGKFLRCPVHGYLFDPIDGRVERGTCRRATVRRVEEKDGVARIGF